MFLLAACDEMNEVKPETKEEKEIFRYDYDH